MTKEYRTASEILKEKYEERGWNQEMGFDTKATSTEQIKPLPFSEEEYRSFSVLLAKLALQDKDPNLCETYFELQRRAYYGNRYSPIEEMSKNEQEIWSLGTGEIVEDVKNHIR